MIMRGRIHNQNETCSPSNSKHFHSSRNNHRSPIFSLFSSLHLHDEILQGYFGFSVTWSALVYMQKDGMSLGYIGNDSEILYLTDYVTFCKPNQIGVITYMNGIYTYLNATCHIRCHLVVIKCRRAPGQEQIQSNIFDLSSMQTALSRHPVFLEHKKASVRVFHE